MTIKYLLSGLKEFTLSGKPDVEINKLVFDSRKVERGDVFFAIRGLQVDGHSFIKRAIKNGAKAVVLEEKPEEIDDNVVVIEVKDSSKAMGLIAKKFFENPTKKLRLIGVTGTNGKSTIVYLLYNLFSRLGYKCGMVSTIENKIGNRTVVAKYTTPDVISINGLLADMVEEGCEFAFMEVSSHAIQQNRITGLHFSGGVFTNLTRDHLDYHGTMSEYASTKKAFFDSLSSGAYSLVNKDDKHSEFMVQNTKAKGYTYSCSSICDYHAKIIDISYTGLKLRVNGVEVESRLIGKFNAYNFTAVYGVAMLEKMTQMEVLREMSNLSGIEGRMDIVFVPGSEVLGIVDFAHTADALRNVLETLAQIKRPNQKIITVFGCGGDRDKGKRPRMGMIAALLSDEVIVTSDNPRTENPEQIIEDIMVGIENESNVLTIVDRRSAIKTAVKLSKPGDIILVAGKGHEKYQIIGKETKIFDDKKEIYAAMQKDI